MGFRQQAARIVLGTSAVAAMVAACLPPYPVWDTLGDLTGYTGSTAFTGHTGPTGLTGDSGPPPFDCPPVPDWAPATAKFREGLDAEAWIRIEACIDPDSQAPTFVGYLSEAVVDPKTGEAFCAFVWRVKGSVPDETCTDCEVAFQLRYEPIDVSGPACSSYELEPRFGLDRVTQWGVTAPPYEQLLAVVEVDFEDFSAFGGGSLLVDRSRVPFYLLYEETSKYGF